MLEIYQQRYVYNGYEDHTPFWSVKLALNSKEGN